MGPLPPPVLRGIGAATEGSGRTVAIAGPPLAGKSELLSAIREDLSLRQWRAIEIVGSYRDRETPYAALAGFGAPAKPDTAAPEGRDGTSAGPAAWPWAPLATPPTPAGDDSRRRRRGGSDRTSLLNPPSHRRGGRVVTGPDVHAEVLRTLSEVPIHPVALFIEDAALLDPESRESILYLSERVRYRPILLVAALDVSLPAFGAWEERLLRRGDVEWVRFEHAKPDPREADRFRETFVRLPSATREVLIVTAILGGSAGEVRLSRVSKLGLPELAEALAPAVAENIVRVGDGRVTIAHAGWIEILPGFATESKRREVHREIGEALSALQPEPDLKGALELARHFYEASPDSEALRHLTESAELAERIGAFDTAEELISKALRCLPKVPAAERPSTGAELHLFRARALAFSGRIDEFEEEVREGILTALDTSVEPERSEELVEAIVPAVRTVGPRLSLSVLLNELIVQCAETEARGAEVLLQAVASELEFERGRYDIALSEAERASLFAHELEPTSAKHAKAIVEALRFATEGPTEPEASEGFRVPGAPVFGRPGGYGLGPIADELQLRLMGRRLAPAETLRAHQTAAPALRRMRAPTRELYHLLDLGEMLLDAGEGGKAKPPVLRAREIVDSLHLIPPSPPLLRLWLLEGRLAAFEHRTESARDIWGAMAARPSPSSLPPYEAEAHVRLALLELAEGKPAGARPLLDRLEAPDFEGRFPREWNTSIVDLAVLAEAAREGSGALPTHT
ncbi:MAG: hypothetical protein L3J93_03680 [Thermoplasmata archaeon]|nr:hypothetical protein [Thermoplasmata archaeon]